MIVVDTNVTSELMKPAPSPAVLGWVRNRGAGDLYTTSITLAEIGCGIERLPGGRRKALLKAAAEEVFSAFSSQVLAFDALAALEYATIVRRCERAGTPIDGFDAQVASICRAHDASLATRNVKDFRNTRIEVIDPWSDSTSEVES
jgi:predicted nucleic acid-binding protein